MKSLFRLILAGGLFFGLGCGIASAQPAPGKAPSTEICDCKPGEPCPCLEKQLANKPMPLKDGKPGFRADRRMRPMPARARNRGEMLPPGAAEIRPNALDPKDAKITPQQARPKMRHAPRPNGKKLHPISGNPNGMNCGYCTDLRRTCKPDNPSCKADFDRCNQDCPLR